MRSLVIALALSMAGCAANRSLTDLVAGDRLHGDASGAIIKADSAADAWPLAIGHCAHFRRSAQFKSRQALGVYEYRCVESNDAR